MSSGFKYDKVNIGLRRNRILELLAKGYQQCEISQVQKRKMTRNRTCSTCDASEPEQEILEIVIPPQIIERTWFCRQCLGRVLDNSRKSKETSK